MTFSKWTFLSIRVSLLHMLFVQIQHEKQCWMLSLQHMNHNPTSSTALPQEIQAPLFFWTSNHAWLVIYKDDPTLSPTTQMVYMQPLIRLFCWILVMCKLSCSSFEDWTSHTSRHQFTNYSYSMSHAQASNRFWQTFPQRQPFCQDTEDFIARIQKVEQGAKPVQDTGSFQQKSLRVPLLRRADPLSKHGSNLT